MTNVAFDSAALLAKSRVFIERGLVARDAADFGLFHTWAALALELLGKAALAHVHPALVADPTKFPSLLAACGRLDTDDVRSIAAKTVYERLRSLSTQYDKRSENFCMLMANRRNEELHSGSSPTTDLSQDAWVSEFWRVAQLILAVRGETLEHWVGKAEAASAGRLIQDSSRALQEAIQSRVRRCADEFERRYPPNSFERNATVEAAMNSVWPTGLRTESEQHDSHEKHDCPSCQCQGWIFGHELGEHRGEPEYQPDEGWVQWVDTDYDSEAFACPTCGLRLIGRQELDAAGLPELFTKTEAAEPDYGDDYGND